MPLQDPNSNNDKLKVIEEAEALPKSGVYQILNTIDGKVYIGSATVFNKRRWHHFNSDKTNIHLYRAISKYGKEYFKFSVLEYVRDVTLLVSREQFWIDEAKASGIKLYNMALEVVDRPLGVKHSQATIEKCRLANTGKRRTEETKERLRQAWKVRLGKPGAFTGKRHTEESKELMRQAKRDWRPTAEMIKKNRHSHLGHLNTVEHNEAIRWGMRESWKRRRANLGKQ